MTESLIERVKKLGIAFEENLPLSQYTTFLSLIHILPALEKKEKKD